MSSGHKPVLKVILCGEYGVGKSSLFRRFVYNSFEESQDKRSTLGFDNYDKLYTIDSRNMMLQLWDTGGLERVASMTTNYYKFAEAAILVFSYDSQESFSMLSQHMLEILANAENAKIFLCGNKCDIQARGDGPSQELVNAFLSEYRISPSESMILKNYDVSCKTGKGVHEMFEDVARQVMRSLRPHIELQEHFQLKRSSSEKPIARSGGCCSNSNSPQQMRRDSNS